MLYIPIVVYVPALAFSQGKQKKVIIRFWPDDDSLGIPIY